VRLISNTINIIICLVVLSSSIGIPVIFNHIHSSDTDNNHTEAVQEMVGEEVMMCCGSEQKKPLTTEIKESNCNCNLLASCCCCFVEVELVAFSFDIPLSVPLNSPDFVEAYSTQIHFTSKIWSNSTSVISNFELPPPKPYSQQLSVFQVFRI